MFVYLVLMWLVLLLLLLLLLLLRQVGPESFISGGQGEAQAADPADLDQRSQAEEDMKAERTAALASRRRWQQAERPSGAAMRDEGIKAAA